MKKTIFPTHFILLEEPLSDVEIDTSVALSALSSRWNETDAPPEAAEYVAPEKDADSEQLLLLPHFCAPAEHVVLSKGVVRWREMPPVYVGLADSTS